MAGTPTPWAGFRLPAEGDQPDVPADLIKLGGDVDALLKLIFTSGPSSSTPVPTTGQNLLNVGPSITALQSTQSTQAGQITSLNSNVTALQTSTAVLSQTPWATAAWYTGLAISINSSAGGGVQTEIQDVTIPTASYKRLLLCYSSVVASWSDLATRTVMAQNTGIVIGTHSYLPIQVSGTGTPVQTMSGFFLCTIPAGTSGAFVYQMIGLDGYSAWPSGKSIKVATSAQPGTVLYMAAIPWSNGPDVVLSF